MVDMGEFCFFCDITVFGKCADFSLFRADLITMGYNWSLLRIMKHNRRILLGSGPFFMHFIKKISKFFNQGLAKRGPRVKIFFAQNFFLHVSGDSKHSL